MSSPKPRHRDRFERANLVYERVWAREFLKALDQLGEQHTELEAAMAIATAAARRAAPHAIRDSTG